MPAALVPIAPSHNRAKAFGGVFCATLSHFKDSTGRSWGNCGQYLETIDAPQAQAKDFTSPSKILLVAGLGDACMKDVHAFSTSIAHLKNEHRIEIDAVSVLPYAPSSDNGRTIARHIDDGWKNDPARRRYILVGYSKGAVDLLEALEMLEAPATKVAALVTVAGMVGGTPEGRAFEPLLNAERPWMDRQCPANIGRGLYSLQPDIRLRFPKQSAPLVPTYAVVGATAENATSQVFRPSWKRLSRYAAEQDGILPAWQGILDGATFLGMARADHWAIALPFDDASSHPKGIDHNRFPRDALLEALVRFVAADTAKPERPAQP